MNNLKMFNFYLPNYNKLIMYIFFIILEINTKKYLKKHKLFKFFFGHSSYKLNIKIDTPYNNFQNNK